jgi:phage tail-like protein
LPTSSSSNPYVAYNFLVEIAGVQAASFTECVLPVASIEVIEYREGADVMDNIHKLPGLVRYGNLVLKRGLANSMALWDWFSSFATGTGTKALVTVTLLDSGRVPVIRWGFKNAWPVKYESPLLGGKTNALAIETLELAVEEMTMMSALSQGS